MPEKSAPGDGVRPRRGLDEADRDTVTQTLTRATAMACRMAAIVLGAATLQGCGMSSITSGLGGMWGGSQSNKTEVGSVNEEQLLSAAKSEGGGVETGTVAQGCPRFQAWSRDNAVTIYEAGRAGDSLAVMHRGEITKTARECQIESGRITVRYGFSGRVLLGPRGKPGVVTLPLTVFVTDAKRERIASEKVLVEVPVALEKPIGYFSTVKTVTFSIPEGTRPAEFEVFVGFDRNIPGAG